MTEAETRELLQQAQAGSSAAEGALIKGHNGLVRRVAKQYHKGYGCLPFADLMQEGRIGLLTAIRTFDLDRTGADRKPIKFSTYANWKILRAIQTAVGRFPQLKQEVEAKLPSNWKVDDGSPDRDHPYLLSAQVDPASVKQDPPDIEPLLDLLTDDELGVIVLLFGLEGVQPMTGQEAADFLDCSREHVVRVRRQALAKMQGLAGQLFSPGKTKAPCEESDEG